METQRDNKNEQPAATEIDLDVEELEAVIAPGLGFNDNETLVTDAGEVDPIDQSSEGKHHDDSKPAAQRGGEAEERDAAIDPGATWNHNETLVSDDEIDLAVEELEPVIAPGVSLNHNETLISDGEIDLDAEELEAVIAPGNGWNHNERLVSDDEIDL